jgi:hypothetical protein
MYVGPVSNQLDKNHQMRARLLSNVPGKMVNG